ncbi:hypothetical protein [Streptomyces sp. NPDC006879]|uniref:hypothetical protein n=1 Tax=Streptomyces sp. NPDC006879 TaxID=3364767 RepID=UPI0036ABF2F5
MASGESQDWLPTRCLQWLAPVARPEAAGFASGAERDSFRTPTSALPLTISRWSIPQVRAQRMRSV